MSTFSNLYPCTSGVYTDSFCCGFDNTTLNGQDCCNSSHSYQFQRGGAGILLAATISLPGQGVPTVSTVSVAATTVFATVTSAPDTSFSTASNLPESSCAVENSIALEATLYSILGTAALVAVTTLIWRERKWRRAYSDLSYQVNGEGKEDIAPPMEFPSEIQRRYPENVRYVAAYEVPADRRGAELPGTDVSPSSTHYTGEKVF